MSSLESVRFARAYAAEQLPWFAPALFRCNIVITPLVDVAAIDLHYNVYWNPNVVDHIYGNPNRRAALSELAFLWVHEISHRLRHHAERAPGATAGAGTLPAILRSTIPRGRDCVCLTLTPGMLPEDFGFDRGLLAEQYLSLMDASDHTYAFTIDEGSGVHGQPRPWETGERQRISPIDEEIIRREVARRTRDADAAEVPDGWREWAAEVLGSRVNWRQRLGHRLSVSIQQGIGSRTDYSYARPNRRQSVYAPILPPSLGGTLTANIAIVVDTSASMAIVDLQRSLSEVAGVVRAVQRAGDHHSV